MGVDGAVVGRGGVGAEICGDFGGGSGGDFSAEFFGCTRGIFLI
jgi:hypothetical protein